MRCQEDELGAEEEEALRLDESAAEGAAAAEGNVDEEAADEASLEAAMNAALTTQELSQLQQVRLAASSCPRGQRAPSVVLNFGVYPAMFVLLDPILSDSTLAARTTCCLRHLKDSPSLAVLMAACEGQCRMGAGSAGSSEGRVHAGPERGRPASAPQA